MTLYTFSILQLCAKHFKDLGVVKILQTYQNDYHERALNPSIIGLKRRVVS